MQARTMPNDDEQANTYNQMVKVIVLDDVSTCCCARRFVVGYSIDVVVFISRVLPGLSYGVRVYPIAIFLHKKSFNMER